MTCILFGPDARKRTASLLLDMEQIDRVITGLDDYSNETTVPCDVGNYSLKLTIGEIRDVFESRAAKIEHELALLGIKLREEGTPDETKPSLPSIDRARQDAALAVTDSVTGTGESA